MSFLRNNLRRTLISSRTNSILKMKHQLRTRNLKHHLRKKRQTIPHLIRIIKMQVLTLASSTAYQIRLRATKMKEANNLAGTRQEVLKLERRMSKHLDRLPAKIQEITTRDRVIITNEEEVVVDTKEEATIKVEEGITTKILETTTIAVAAATAEVAAAMAASMKEAVEATLTIKEAEEAIINPSTMRAELGDQTLSNGATTTAVAKITTTEVVAAALDRAAILIKMAVITKVAEVVQTLISTNRDPLVPHQLKEADIREEGTTLSNSGSTQSLKVLKPQQKKMENSKKSDASLFSYCGEYCL
jgi:hypothetical protein